MQEPRTPRYSEGPADYHLPASLTRGIGAIIVRWAYFEYAIQRMIWSFAGVDERVGRLAIRELSIKNRLELMSDLAALRGIVLNADVMAKLKRSAEAMAGKRSLLAHGVWRRNGGDWSVQLTRGTYNDDQATDHDTNRRIAPEAIHVDTASLYSVADNIEKLIEGARLIKEALPRELPPLRDKRPPRSSHPGRGRGQATSKPPSQPKS